MKFDLSKLSFLSIRIGWLQKLFNCISRFVHVVVLATVMASAFYYKTTSGCYSTHTAGSYNNQSLAFENFTWVLYYFQPAEGIQGNRAFNMKPFLTHFLSGKVYH